MALSDRKIPILTGVNDVPSTEGQANHPNDSLLCANYNALIDDLSTAISNYTPINYNEIDAFPLGIYVSSVTGNDATGNGTELSPYATIQKAIDVVCEEKIVWAGIYLEGVFINPRIDLSNYYTIFSSSYYDGDDIVDTWYEQAGLYIYGNYADNNAIIRFDRNTIDDSINNTTRANIPYSLIYSPNSAVKFAFVDFEFKGDENNVIQNSNIFFRFCSFSLEEHPSNWTDAILQIYNSNISFESSSFSYNTNNAIYPISAFNSSIYIDGLSITMISGETSVYLIKARNSDINIKNYPSTPAIDLSYIVRSNVFMFFGVSENAATFLLDETTNNVKLYGNH